MSTTPSPAPLHLSRTDIYVLYHALGKASDLVTAPKASYTVATLRSKLKPLIEDVFEVVRKTPPHVTVIEKARLKICADHAEKGNDGEPLMQQVNGQMRYVIAPAKATDFKTAMDAHNAKNKADIDAWQAKVEEINDLMKELYTELDFNKLPKIDLAWFANIPASVLEPLLPILHADDATVKSAEMPAIPTTDAKATALVASLKKTEEAPVSPEPAPAPAQG